MMPALGADPPKLNKRQNHNVSVIVDRTVVRPDDRGRITGADHARRLPGQRPRAQGVGRGIRHVSYSDLGGRPDSVQIMMNRRHLYVGHMFSNGLTILDASDPRRIRPVSFVPGGEFTRTHHLQVADDLLLLANGAKDVYAYACDLSNDLPEKVLQRMVDGDRYCPDILTQLARAWTTERTQVVQSAETILGRLRDFTEGSGGGPDY
mgnify:CR=1 FL=1